MHHSMTVLLSIASTFLITALVTANPPATPQATPAGDEVVTTNNDIVATAVADGRFTILAKALTDAGLVEALKGKGPFTVFAPTDAAFKKLPQGTLDKLSKDDLIKILKAHVVAGKIMAKDAIAADGKSVKALNGTELPVKVMDGKVTIMGSTVIIPDVASSNGVIHVIDTVIIPK